VKNYHRFIQIVILLIFVGCAPVTAVIKYEPTDNVVKHDNKESDGIKIAILDFPDNRYDTDEYEKMIGTVYGSFKNPLIRIYSEKTISLDVMDAVESLLTANGFQVNKYPGLTDYSALAGEKYVVKGKINKFWTESMYSTWALVDIDIEIFDRQHKKIWSGKFEDEKGEGVLMDTNVMILLLNEALSDAIEKAWFKQGMQNALGGFKKDEKIEKLSADRQEIKKEKPKLAYIPKPATIPKLSLRKNPLKNITETNLRSMLSAYSFFDKSLNPYGSFKNDFIDHNNRTITDNSTGLMWQREGSSKPLGNVSAKSYIKRLNKEQFAGYGDWRLPTIEELSSLISSEKNDGFYLNTLFDRKQNRCWSSDLYAKHQQSAEGWFVNFVDGKIDRALWLTKHVGNCNVCKNEDNYTRAVRTVK